MEASILDLRYHMKTVLKALERNEEIKIFYHGKLKGVLSPVPSEKKMKVQDHPFFGMYRNQKESVDEVMDILRGGRYHVI